MSVKWYKKQIDYDHNRIPNDFCIGYYCIFGKIEGSTEHNKNARLSSFGFTSSKAASLLDFDHADSMAETPCSPPKKRGKYLESWKINRPWLRYDSAQIFCFVTFY